MKSRILAHMPPDKGAAANRRAAWQLSGSGNFSSKVTGDRAIPVAVAEFVG
jgi:hypothetical protein